MQSAGANEGAGLIVAIGGWAVAIILGIFTFIVQWRRGGVDETALVLGKWKELVETHERQLAGLNGEIQSLRERVRELELHARQLAQEVEERDGRITELEREVEGGKRQLKQQAESFAEQLRRLGHNSPPEVGGRNGPQDK